MASDTMNDNSDEYENGQSNVDINGNNFINHNLRLYVPPFFQKAPEEVHNGINIKENFLCFLEFGLW